MPCGHKGACGGVRPYKRKHMGGNSMISVVVAADERNAIGIGGQLPWHLPQDLLFFKHTTWAMPIIMGRKTFESVGKPLPGRTNIVITSQQGWLAAGVEVAHSLPAALEAAEALHTQEIFIVGGGQLYHEALPICHRVYLTRVHTQLANADTWFPPLSPREWQLAWERPFKADDKHAFDYTFQCFGRINGTPSYR